MAWQPVCHFGKMSKFCGQFRRELSRRKPPLPVPAIQTGSVHARFAAQAQHVLQRDESKIGHRGLRRADERPMNAIVAAAKIAFRVAPFMIGGRGLNQPTVVSLSCVPV
jgi:hypothetical protein